DRTQLALELAPAVEPLARQLAGLHRREHGAARLVHVRAVAEAAIGCELLDVGKGRVQRGSADVPQLKLAEAGRVDYEPAAGQDEQLAVRRGMAALVVVLARLARDHHLLAEPEVDERRLADARRAEQHGRGAAGDPR